MAELTDKFTGADITEMCQRAAKAAIREAISAEEDKRRLDAENGEDVAMDSEVADPVPVITRAHFEEAFSQAKRSVDPNTLLKFEEFRKKFDPVYAAKQGGSVDARPKINWPEDNSSQFNQADDDDDNLYD